LINVTTSSNGHLFVATHRLTMLSLLAAIRKVLGSNLGPVGTLCFLLSSHKKDLRRASSYKIAIPVSSHRITKTHNFIWDNMIFFTISIHVLFTLWLKALISVAVFDEESLKTAWLYGERRGRHSKPSFLQVSLHSFSLVNKKNIKKKIITSSFK
jgi:hypothetical protein